MVLSTLSGESAWYFRHHSEEFPKQEVVIVSYILKPFHPLWDMCLMYCLIASFHRVWGELRLLVYIIIPNTH